MSQRTNSPQFRYAQFAARDTAAWQRATPHATPSVATRAPRSRTTSRQQTSTVIGVAAVGVAATTALTAPRDAYAATSTPSAAPPMTHLVPLFLAGAAAGMIAVKMAVERRANRERAAERRIEAIDAKKKKPSGWLANPNLSSIAQVDCSGVVAPSRTAEAMCAEARRLFPDCRATIEEAPKRRPTDDTQHRLHMVLPTGFDTATLLTTLQTLLRFGTDNGRKLPFDETFLELADPMTPDVQTAFFKSLRRVMCDWFHWVEVSVPTRLGGEDLCEGAPHAFWSSPTHSVALTPTHSPTSAQETVVAILHGVDQSAKYGSGFLFPLDLRFDLPHNTSHTTVRKIVARLLASDAFTEVPFGQTISLGALPLLWTTALLAVGAEIDVLQNASSLIDLTAFVDLNHPGMTYGALAGLVLGCAHVYFHHRRHNRIRRRQRLDAHLHLFIDGQPIATIIRNDHLRLDIETTVQWHNTINPAQPSSPSIATPTPAPSS